MSNLTKVLYLVALALFSSNIFAVKIIDRLEEAVRIDKNIEPSSITSFSLLFSKEEKGTLYGLVEYQSYSNGGCRDRGTCGCGIESYSASIIINSQSKTPQVQHVHLGGCSVYLSPSVVENEGITTIALQKLSDSCYATSKYSGMTFYTYDEKLPQLGFRSITGDEYTLITGKDPTNKPTEEIIMDDCFYEIYLITQDYEWRGAYERRMIFKKIKDKQGRERAGDFVGYIEKNGVTRSNNPNIRPQRFPQYTRSKNLPIPPSPNKLLKMALSHYKNKQYSEAESLYYKLIRNNTKFIYPGKLSVLNDLALTQYKLKKYDESISWSLELLRNMHARNYDTVAASANYNLGLVYEDKGNLKQAQSYYEKSDAINESRLAKQALQRVIINLEKKTLQNVD